MTCLAVDNLAPKGFTVVGGKFHTHPSADRTGHIQLHPYTIQFAQEVGQVLPSTSHVRLPNAAGYSKQDIEQGGGYLAAEGTLQLHANGQTQDLGRIQAGKKICQITR